MTRRSTRFVSLIFSLVLSVLLCAGFVVAARYLHWPIGVRSESHDSQVIYAVERTQEVSLVSLGIQGIKEDDKSGTLFGKQIPGTGKKVFVEYNFHAKLGIDGGQVTVKRTGAGSYLISVPKFTFIGYDRPTFKVAAEDGGVLSFVTADIDKVKIVNEILNSTARKKYIDNNEALLEEQTKTFYDTLIKSIAPDAVTTYEFRS